jgi:hypothetical protein
MNKEVQDLIREGEIRRMFQFIDPISDEEIVPEGCFSPCREKAYESDSKETDRRILDASCM